jgi:ligand-binding sensor domain-containing protein
VTRFHALLWLVLLLVGSVPAAGAPRRPHGLAALNVSALASTSERLYAAGFDEGLFVVERDGSSRRIEHPALSPHINALAWSEPSHQLWIGTARGLARCEMSRPHPSCERVGAPIAVHALLLLRDGSLLAGGDAGLTFVAGTTRSFGKKQGAPFRSVWSLAENDGRLYVGTTNGLFWGEPVAFGPGQGKLQRAAVVLGTLPDDWVTALLVVPGRLLVGTYNAGAVRFVLGSNELESDGHDPALGYVNPAGLFAFGEKGLAVASMDGLRSGAFGGTARLATSTSDVTAIAPALGGGYWVGTRHGLEWLDSLAPPRS